MPLIIFVNVYPCCTFSDAYSNDHAIVLLHGVHVLRTSSYCFNHSQAKDQKEPTLYTNRALCQLKLEQWDKASNDCQTAIQLNSSSIKAHFYFGQAQLELENFDVAIDALQTG